MWVWSLLSGTKSGMSRTTEASRPLTSLPWTCFSSLKTYSGLSSDHNLPTMYWVQLGTPVFSIPSLQREALHHISDFFLSFFDLISPYYNGVSSVPRPASWPNQLPPHRSLLASSLSPPLPLYCSHIITLLFPYCRSVFFLSSFTHSFNHSVIVYSFLNHPFH